MASLKLIFSGANCYETFFFKIKKWSKKLVCYLSEATYWCFTLGQAPGLTRQHNIRLERPTADKQSTLFGQEPTLERSTSKGLHSGRFEPYLETLNQAGKKG